MAVTSYRITQYMVECDVCGENECCPDSLSENVHSKREAAKWAGMHTLKDGTVLCKNCFEKYKLRGKVNGTNS